MKYLSGLFILLTGSTIFAQNSNFLPKNFPSPQMYSLDIQANGSVGANDHWRRESVDTSEGGLKSTIYESKDEASGNRSAIEIDQNKAGKVDTIMAFREVTDRYNKTSSEVRITSYTDNNKVKSSTTCWNDGGCATVNQDFCERVKRSIGANSNAELKSELKTCEKISSTFRDAARGSQKDLKILQSESTAEIKKWTSSKAYSKYVKTTTDKVLDSILGDDGFILPKFSGGYAEQMKIYSSLTACDYLEETHAFEDSKRDDNTSRKLRKSKSAN